MQLQTQADFDITNSIESKIAGYAKRLEKFDIRKIDLHLKKQGHLFKASATTFFSSGKQSISRHSESTNMYAAIQETFEKIIREVRHAKSHHKGGESIKELSEDIET